MSKERYDQILDVKIKAAGLKYLEKIADEAPLKEELEQFNTPSEKLDNRIKTSLNSFKHKLRIKKAFKMASIAVVALILLVGVSCITITSTEALRVKFNNLFVNDTGKSLELSAANGLESEMMPEGSDKIKPGYLPKGCILTEADIAITSITNSYINKDNSTIRITRSQDVGAITLDKENADNYETKIKGNLAIVMETKHSNSIFYFSNNYYYHIMGEGIATEVLIKIAENLPK